ncbi:hypothetical protein DPMN_046093 [Dreissena polymorpha]|uniref:Uncharacterized protein n=1 Tax=Dreissena polymorpha TaxID=45954 RepID=A0A9D4D5B2_DREPO|nr:hypothetical protein DPMN_046093 [Dreissena polymorpha]
MFQPLMALIRPAPDGEYRFLFNWAHFLVGTSAHILAGQGLNWSRKVNMWRS